MATLVFLAAALAAEVPDGDASPAYWHSGQRVQGSWYATHPHLYTYSYISVDAACGNSCHRWLNSPTSGHVQSFSKIHHYGSGTGVLSCMWDTLGTGNSVNLDCYKS